MSNNAFYELLNESSPVTHTFNVTATLDFPSIAAAGTQTLTVNCPGVGVNDIVAMSLPATVNAGVVYDARVSAANTISVRASNITAAAIDPAAGFFNFLVLKTT